MFRWGCCGWGGGIGEFRKLDSLRGSSFGEGRTDILIRLCMVADWCIDHSEYTVKIKAIPKKDYPVLMPCEF